MYVEFSRENSSLSRPAAHLASTSALLVPGYSYDMSSSDEDDALAASFMRSIWGDGPSRPPTPPEAPPPQDVSFTFGDFTVTLVAGPANPGRTLSMIIWRSSLIMARAMLAMFSRGELGSDRTVLELGAGRGLCGLLAHQMGSSVCTTDCSYDDGRAFAQRAARTCRPCRGGVQVGRDRG